MTFEQFLEAHGLEEDFKDSGMTPEDFMKSVFEEEPVHNCESIQMQTSIKQNKKYASFVNI